MEAASQVCVGAGDVRRCTILTIVPRACARVRRLLSRHCSDEWLRRRQCMTGETVESRQLSVRGGRVGIYIRIRRSGGSKGASSRVPVHILLAHDSVLDSFASQCNVVLGGRSVRIDLHEADSLDREDLFLGTVVHGSERERPAETLGEYTYGAILCRFEAHAVFQVGGTARREVFALRTGISRRLLGRNEHVAVFSVQGASDDS